MEGYSIDFCLKTGETRVWRTYVGGATLNAWHGRTAESGFFPEDWAASTTRAVNAGRENLVEGLSRVVSMSDQPYLLDLIAQNPEAFFGRAHMQAFGAQAGFLVKLIDAQERLTIQVHPDQQYAKTVLHSDYGKTESWYVLGGDNHGEKPCIYIGFKPGVTREKWKALFEAQDIEGMLDCLHRVTVEPGDCFIIKGGVPHAIGAGCFLAELQEPTDYTMRVELTTPGGLHIQEKQCHQGVGYEKMLDCFHYEGLTLEETLARWKAEPKEIERQTGGTEKSCIDERVTELFTMRLVDVASEMTLPAQTQMCVSMVISGAGELRCGDERLTLERGDTFVTRAGCPQAALRAAQGMKVLRCYPPKP